MNSSGRTGPAFQGLVLYEDRQWRCYFWYPKGWHSYTLDGNRIGFLCSPLGDQPTTFFSLEVTPLETTVEPNDLDMLLEGVQEGLAALPGLAVESSQQSAAGSRIEIERTFAFEDQGWMRKRRLRLIYDRDRLYTLISQGSTEDEYQYWLSMLNYCHLTFTIGLFDTTGIVPQP